MVVGRAKKFQCQRQFLGEPRGSAARGPVSIPGSWELGTRVMTSGEPGGEGTGEMSGSLASLLCHLSDLLPSNQA